ncbi:hypothetical protein CEXT_83631 [Caerostris extrusa]|uniref:Secreted protein n=1 Tax=Caerostris extrusa TaxID=172846 RepID=A0AAV4PRD6_CAEEX|nr:hypothetical protein CEXT_83631 [Caerostris extrusa]
MRFCSAIAVTMHLFLVCVSLSLLPFITLNARCVCLGHTVSQRSLSSSIIQSRQSGFLPRPSLDESSGTIDSTAFSVTKKVQ